MSTTLEFEAAQRGIRVTRAGGQEAASAMEVRPKGRFSARCFGIHSAPYPTPSKDHEQAHPDDDDKQIDGRRQNARDVENQGGRAKRPSV